MQSKNIQHRGEFGSRFTPFRNRRRGRNNPGTGKETYLITQQLRTTDRHHPFAVAFIVTPADDAKPGAVMAPCAVPAVIRLAEMFVAFTMPAGSASTVSWLVGMAVRPVADSSYARRR